MLSWIKKLFKKKEKKPEPPITEEPDFNDLQKPDIEIEEEKESEQTTLPPTPPSENEQSLPPNN